MKRCLYLVTLISLTASLHGCALWWWDHDYDPSKDVAHLEQHQTPKVKSLAAR